jgi:hypothetical protein
MTRKRIIVDAIGCIFNLMEWLNRRTSNLPGKGAHNLEFHQLVCPSFVDNYPDSQLQKHFSDVLLAENLLRQDSVYAINMVDGAKEALKAIENAGVEVIIAMPFSFIGRRLESLRMLEDLPMNIHHYLSSMEKYPDKLIDENLICIIDDLRDECDDLEDKGATALLLDMPWNKGTTKGRRVNNWSQIAKFIEKELNNGKVSKT